MPMTPEQTRARAQNAARKRWHGDQADVAEPLAELERAANDRLVHEVEARAPKFSPEQIAVLRRVFRYGPPTGEAASG